MVAVEGKSHWNSNVLHLFSQQNAILQNLYVNVPVEFDFLFSESHAEVISGKQEGISTLASSPDKAIDYLRPLLRYAADYIPVVKHKETQLYILCTAGMRLLPESQQNAILQNLYVNVPVEFDFLFSESHAEVISGKQEGISTLASSPDKAIDYLRPLLRYAADYIPVVKHKETQLYILCTAGLSLLPERYRD
ncbi:nucleoside-triphosphatase ntp-1-like [Hemitrygon akajei]|uniref:nucleoside-triphosphatase ntp-1-like n=1 Tax=Hemitrygon akajei TaxID=2704970 RepID=UPI003BFA09B4